MPTLKQEYYSLLALTYKHLHQVYTPTKEMLLVTAKEYQTFSPIKALAPSPPPIIQKAAPKPSTLPTKELAKPPEKRSPKEPLKASAPPSSPLATPVPIVEESKHSFNLNTQECKYESAFSDQKAFFSTHFPQLNILEEVPPDTRAHQQAAGLNGLLQKEGCFLLQGFETPEESLFLQNLATAIQQRLSPCYVIPLSAFQSNEHWQTLDAHPQLRCLITCESNSKFLQDKLQNFSTFPKLLFKNVSQYLKNPQLKAELWKALINSLG